MKAKIQLRRSSRRYVWILVVYFVAGTASQKLVPGIDEIFPFFGWSLFSTVPGPTTTYRLLIHEFDGRKVDPPVSLLEAPPEMVGGDRFIARKVVQRFGRESADGDTRSVTRLRRLIERSYLTGEARYELIVERYQPLTRWRTGEADATESLGWFVTGDTATSRRGRRRERPL